MDSMIPMGQQMAVPKTSQTEMMISRQAQEVQGAIVMAKKFPRDEYDAMERIKRTCQRATLAEQAIYSYPRGGQTVMGPSIRLAEALAQNWGNIDYGVIELEQKNGSSEMMAYAWDLESNTRVTKIFTVEHKRDTRKGTYQLTDSRDIYEATVAVKFIMNVAESDMKLHVIAGNTTGVIEKNIINADMGLLQIFPNLEYCGNGDKENKLPHIKFKTGSSTKIIYILGYDNASKWKNALGSQFGCVWVDECNTANIDFIREIFGRSEYFVGTLNPDAPTLPIYSEYINHARPIDKYKADVPEEIWKDLNGCEPIKDWVYWFFTFEDNISMTPEKIEQKKMSYPPGTKIYKNKILGLRGKATGLVFSNFCKRHVITKEQAKVFIKQEYDDKQTEWFVIYTSGLDTAYSTKSPDTIAMSFMGITNKGKLIVLDEKVYNNAALDIPIAPSDTVKNYIDFLERNRKEWGGMAKNTFIDNADQATITEFAKYKREHHECLYIFNNAYKKVTIIDRINLQLGWMSFNDEKGKEPSYYVVDTCTNYTGELQVYSWLEDKDCEPEDGNDHMVNSTQYGWIPYRDKVGVENG